MLPLQLKQPMGTNYRVDPEDIVSTKTALSQLGYYDAPPHRGIDDWTDDALFDGIRRFQKDRGLKVDGFMRPGGPTETAINSHMQRMAYGDSLFGGDGGQDSGNGGWSYSTPQWPATCNAPPACGQNPGPGDGKGKILSHGGYGAPMFGVDNRMDAGNSGWSYACPDFPSTCNAPPACGQNPGPGDGKKKLFAFMDDPFRGRR